MVQGSGAEVRRLRRRTLLAFSDAQYRGPSKLTGDAAVGAVILTGEGRLRGEAAITLKRISINTAELRGVALAVQTALSAVDQPNAYDLMCFTDCHVAYGYLTGQFFRQTHLQRDADLVRKLGEPFNSVRFYEVNRETVAIRRCETVAKQAWRKQGIIIPRRRGISSGKKRNRGIPWNPYKEGLRIVHLDNLGKG